jgi:hypothetical protein
VAFGVFLLMISTAACKNLRNKRSGFSTVTTGTAAINYLGELKSGNPKRACVICDEGVQNLVRAECRPLAGFEVITIGRFWGDNRGTV